MTHRLNLLLLVLIVAIGAPFYWLLIENEAKPGPARHLDIVELRQLAGSMPGNRPSGVEVQRVATTSAPQTLFAAGSGFRMASIAAMAFRLPVEGGRAIMIDSGTDAASAAAMGFTEFHPAAQARVDRALEQAGLILLTHEHADHMGGVAALVKRRGALPALRLNPAQAAPADAAAMAQWQGAKPVASLPVDRPIAVAPGVVVIPAPDSHTAGSQMIFVRLANGEELLFTGDVAMISENWMQLRLGARMLGAYLNPSNRANNASWLAALHDLAKAEPNLVIVAGHDIRPLTAGRSDQRARIGF